MSRIAELARRFGTPEQLAKHSKPEEPAVFIPYTNNREELPIDDNRFLAHYIRTAEGVVGGKYNTGSETNRNRLKALVLKLNKKEPYNQFLVISGLHGSGKTTIIHTLAKMLYGREQGFRIQQSNRLNDLALKDGYFEGLKHFENVRLCINDFGYKDEKLKHYGNELDALDKLVYNRWEIHGLATYFTTNIQTKEDFLNQFSKRTRERIKHDMLFVVFNETNHRDKTAAK